MRWRPHAAEPGRKGAAPGHWCAPLRVEGPPPAVDEAADAKARGRARLLPIRLVRMRMRAVVVAVGATLLLARLSVHMRMPMVVPVLMCVVLVSMGWLAALVCRGVPVVIASMAVRMTVAMRSAIACFLLCLQTCTHPD